MFHPLKFQVMKKFVLLAAILLYSLSFFVSQAQPPQNFNYQAIVRDNTGNPLLNQNVNFRTTILQGSASGANVYSESQIVKTNGFGLATLSIGGGTVINGSFSGIHWGTDKYFLQTEVDITGGTTFTLMGASQLLSVPYALYAANSSSPKFAQPPLIIKNDSIEINKTGVVKGNMITYDGNNWVTIGLDVNHPIVDEMRSATPASNMQPYLAVNYCIALQGIFPSRSGSNPFLGEIEIFGFNFAPTGWAMCNGQEMAISQNTALFSLLGTMYGGNGTTTFALPNLQGRVPIHVGQGSGLTNRNQGDSGGTETITIQYNDKHRQ